MNTISRKQLMSLIIEADELENFDDCSLLCQVMSNPKDGNGEFILTARQSEIIEFYL